MFKSKLFVIVMVLFLSILLISSCNNKGNSTTDDDHTNDPPQTTPDDTEGDNNEECPHNYGEWQVILDSTCTQKGQEIRICSLCMHIENSDIELKEHTVVAIDRVEPTCVIDGKTEGKMCSVCKEVLIAQETIKASGHTYIEGVCSCGAIDENYVSTNFSSSGLTYVISEDKSHYIVSAMTDDTNLNVLIPGTYNGLPVEEIAAYAFVDCHFESIWFENGVKYIGDWAFLRCESLTKVIFPQSLVSIGDAAFNVTNVTEVHISDLSAWCKVSSNAGTNIFNENTYLYVNGTKLTDLIIPDDVMTINGAFSGLQTLKSVTVPGRLKSISKGEFFGCSGLTEVIIENGVTSIGVQAFGWCSSLAKITLPNSITYISSNVFQHCEALTDVYYKGADCQASATPKNASKGESQPKHFFGLKLIDKTIFCKVSLSNE